MNNFDKILKSMNCGWFILKLAEDYGVYTGSSSSYGESSSMETRESLYKTSFAIHKDLLIYLLNNWSKGIRGGNPKVSNSDLHNIAQQILNKMGISVLNTPIKTKKRKSSKNISNLVDEFPFYGCDSNKRNVMYEEDIEEDKKVEGLTRILEECIYHCRHYLYELFGMELPEIDVILSKDKPTEDIENDIAVWIKTQVNLLGKDISVDQIREIINREHMKVNVGGVFVSNENMDKRPYIVIYYTNTVIKDPNLYWKYLTEMCMRLAHEYFHYFHYIYAKKDIYKTYSKWETRAVCESLADIFAYEFLKNVTFSDYLINQNRLIVADERYQIWRDYFGSKFPYAEALRYFDVLGNIEHTKILDVLNLSKLSINKAYKRLIK